MLRQKTLVVSTKDPKLTEISSKKLAVEMKTVFVPGMHSCIEYIYNSIPDLLIIDMTDADANTVGLLNSLKKDPVFSQLQVLAVLKEGAEPPDDILIDDYLWRQSIEKELYFKVRLCLMRAERSVDVNPLTRLPGNIAITKQIQQRLQSGELFALAHIDLNHFKPYNDRYGFTRGDEVLKMSGRLIFNNVMETQPMDSFTGHIGGDDFVYITTLENSIIASTNIMKYFDRIIATFYDKSDKENGYITSTDREGISKTFSFMTLSIGITHNSYRQFTHYGEMASASTEMNKYAKTYTKSMFCIDERGKG